MSSWSALDVVVVPGRNESWCSVAEHLALGSLGTVRGLDLDAAFVRRPFSEQVDAVKRLVRSWPPQPDTLMVGRSFGGYLLLHALWEDEAHPGGLVLVSSVLGAGGSHRLGFIPPRAAEFERRVAEGQTPCGRTLLIHTRDDPQCPFAGAERVALQIGATLHALDVGGHSLGGAPSALVARIVADFANPNREGR